LSGSKETITPEPAAVSSPARRPQRDGLSEDLLVHPPQEGPVELEQLLAGHVRQDRTALSLIHQVPHRRDGGLAPALVSHLGVIGDEVEFAAAMVKPSLLDFMVAHEKLAG
jgi:hypothetical protein